MVVPSRSDTRRRRLERPHAGARGARRQCNHAAALKAARAAHPRIRRSSLTWRSFLADDGTPLSPAAIAFHHSPVGGWCRAFVRLRGVRGVVAGRRGQSHAEVDWRPIRSEHARLDGCGSIIPGRRAAAWSTGWPGGPSRSPARRADRRRSCYHGSPALDSAFYTYRITCRATNAVRRFDFRAATSAEREWVGGVWLTQCRSDCERTAPTRRRCPGRRVAIAHPGFAHSTPMVRFVTL